MNRVDTLRQLFVVMDNRSLGDSNRSFFADGFDEQRKLQTLGPAYLSIHWEHSEVWYQQTVIRKDHLRQRLIVGQCHTARITTGVSLLHQFQITDDVLIVKWITVKLLEQVESNVRLVFHQRIADIVELIVQTDGIDLMAHLLQGRDHVVLSFYFQLFFVGETIQRIRRHEVLVD